MEYCKHEEKKAKKKKGHIKEKIVILNSDEYDEK